MSAEDDLARNRAAQIAETALGPDSLVGSYLQRWEQNDIVEQGLVVAEPQAGIYLLAVFHADAETVSHQRLVAVGDMIPSVDDMVSEWFSGYLFFDSANWLTKQSETREREAG